MLEGRQILDVVLIANEAIDSRLKNGLNGVICKLDIKKTCDYVSQAGFREILDKMGFGKNWIN